MKYLDDLATRALLGTSRDTSPLPAPPDALAEVLSPPAGASLESSLLRSAAVATIYHRAGLKPLQVPAPLPECPADDRAEPSLRATSLLQQLLRESDPRLLAEWLTACARANRRPPRRFLPELLDAATRRPDWKPVLRAPVAAAIGAPGLWLARLNPDWASLLSEDTVTNPDELWQTGAKPERLAALRRLRESAPDHARELLLSTFASEPAADRATFLETFAVNLFAADEAFLEQCLADRSKEVRTTAADLLTRLPSSAYVSRMIARVTPLLAFTPPGKPGLLKKAKPASLSITLPAAFTDDMKADAVEEKAPQGTGQRQHWLTQMLTRIPRATGPAPGTSPPPPSSTRSRKTTPIS